MFEVRIIQQQNILSDTKLHKSLPFITKLNTLNFEIFLMIDHKTMMLDQSFTVSTFVYLILHNCFNVTYQLRLPNVLRPLLFPL